MGDGNKEVRATIWQMSTLAVKPVSKIEDVEDIIRDICDIFVNDYLNENPKK